MSALAIYAQVAPPLGALWVNYIAIITTSSSACSVGQ
jgi:hypothetical protein